MLTGMKESKRFHPSKSSKCDPAFKDARGKTPEVIKTHINAGAAAGFMAPRAATGRSKMFPFKMKRRLWSRLIMFICKHEPSLTELTLMEGITVKNGGKSLCLWPPLPLIYILKTVAPAQNAFLIPPPSRRRSQITRCAGFALGFPTRLRESQKMFNGGVHRKSNFSGRRVSPCSLMRRLQM